MNTPPVFHSIYHEEAAKTPFRLTTTLGITSAVLMTAILLEWIEIEFLLNRREMPIALLSGSGLLAVSGFLIWYDAVYDRKSLSSKDDLKNVVTAQMIACLGLIGVIAYACFEAEAQNVKEHLVFSAIYGVGVGGLAGLAAYNAYKILNPKKMEFE